MVDIRIADHVERASDYNDGQVIFDLIKDDVIHGKPVKVSFDGITAVPSAFINAAFIQLLEVASIDRIRDTLVIVDSTRFINELIRSRFDFSASQSKPH